jgi:glycosyltransferase involved in cell wall biosynthesis
VSPSTSFVTVAVPTYRRPAHLRECLESLLGQDYPADQFEIVVVDDGSADATPDVVREIAATHAQLDVRYVHQAHAGINRARNRAIDAACGDPICFVDDDQVAPPAWLAAIVAGVADFPRAACVGGPMRLRLDGRPPRMCGLEPLGESELDLGPPAREVEYVWGGNMALRRNAIEEVGRFRDDLRLLGGTETEWLDRARAAGRHVVYLPDAWLWHVRTQAELRLRWLLRRHFARGRGQAINGALAGGPFDARRIGRALRASLEHAARERCAVGLIDAARHSGRLVGMAESRLRRGSSAA